MKILAADYILPISSGLVFGGAVAVDEAKIIAVDEKKKLVEKFPEAAVEDFGEAVILPGFVNAHSHLEITAMRGFLDDAENDFFSWLIKLTKTRGEILTDTDIETAAMFGALEGVRAGVTCFADIGRYGRAGFRALKANGLRGILFQETEFSPESDDAENAFDILKEKFLELKIDETELVKVGISPHSPYTVSRQLFEIITDYAVRENVTLTIHAAESVAEENLMTDGSGLFAALYKSRNLEWNAPGTSSVQYLADIGVLRARPLLAHCVRVSDADIELIAASDSRIAHCPKSNLKLGHGTAPLEKFLDRKIRVGLGSDSVGSNNACDLLEEARFAALLARNSADKNRFITAREILATATFGGALALGLETEIGTLEAGKQADLIVVSLDNAAQMPVHDVSSALVFASNARDVKMTMVAGREIYRDGRALNVDEARLKSEMKHIGQKMRVV